MSFHRLPRWVPETISRLIPQRYGRFHRTIIRRRSSPPRQPFRPQMDPFESRESPTSLGGPNALEFTTAAGITSLAAGASSSELSSWDSTAQPIEGFRVAHEEWGAPAGGKSSSSQWISNAALDMPCCSPSASSTLDSQSSVIVSSGDLFPDPFTSDFSLMARPPAGFSSADGGNLHSSAGNGGSLSGSFGGMASAGLAIGASNGPGLVTPNNPGVNSPGSPLRAMTQPASPLSAPTLPTNVLLTPGAPGAGRPSTPGSGSSPLTNTNPTPPTPLSGSGSGGPTLPTSAAMAALPDLVCNDL
jgi:hypothetical protein